MRSTSTSASPTLFQEGLRFTLSRSPAAMIEVGEIYDADDEQIARIKSPPRLGWGCLTILVSVWLFFAMPVLTGWLTNQFLKLMGTNLQAVFDRSMAIGIPLAIFFVASGIVGAMTAAWSLYRRRLSILTVDNEPLLQIVETRKYGAASLTASVSDSKGRLLGELRRNVWGHWTICGEHGHTVLTLRNDRATFSDASKQGSSIALMTIAAFAMAFLLAGVVFMAYSSQLGNYRIILGPLSRPEEELEVGLVFPAEPSARRIQFTGRTTADRQLVIAAVALLLFYDF